jgi:threonine dehydratase
VDWIRNGVDRIVEVDDSEVEAAMRVYFSDTHNVSEGAGAAALASAMQERGMIKGKRIALVLSGDNVDRDIFARILNAEGVRMPTTKSACFF